MSTLLETLRRLGQPEPAVDIDSGNLPVIILSMLADPETDQARLVGLCISLTIKIEQLEERIFELEFGDGSGTGNSA